MRFLKTYEKYETISEGDYVKIKPTIGKTEGSADKLLGPFQHYRDAIFIAREDGTEYNIQLDWAGSYYDYKGDLHIGYAGYMPTKCLQKLTNEEIEQYKLKQTMNKYNL